MQQETTNTSGSVEAAIQSRKLGNNTDTTVRERATLICSAVVETAARSIEVRQ